MSKRRKLMMGAVGAIIGNLAIQSFLYDWKMAVVALMCAIVCGWMAHKKGRRVGLWAVLGFVFGLLSVIVLVCLGWNSKEDTRLSS